MFSHYWNLIVDARDYPAAIPEYSFAKVTHKRRWRFDFAWPELKIAVEVDGGQFAFRGGRHNTDGDREKLNVAAELGWAVFRFSPTMLTNDPVACIGQVLNCINSRKDFE